MQDLPFCILNLTLLLMTVYDRQNKRLDPEDQMCSDEFDINVDFVLVLLIFVTSVGALVFKARCSRLILCICNIVLIVRGLCSVLAPLMLAISSAGTHPNPIKKKIHGCAAGDATY